MSLTRFVQIPVIALTWLLLPSCTKKAETAKVVEEIAQPPMTTKELALPQGGGRVLFKKVDPTRSGLTPHALDDASRAEHGGGLLAQGSVAIGDVNGDGRQDVFVVNGPAANQLFLQKDTLTFGDATEQAGVSGGDAWGTGAALVDLDGDGDLDIYVCNYDSPNQCYLNDGNASFVESGAAVGLNMVSASLRPVFADYDQDGDLDVYILTNRFHRRSGLPEDATFISGKRTIINAEYARWYNVRSMGESSEIYPVGQRDLLYSNRGDGTFENVSDRAGDLCLPSNVGASAVWMDLDQDGDLDLYVANEDEDGSDAFRNEGDGTFKRVTEEMLPYSVWHGRGTAIGDVNGDALLDLFTLSYPQTAVDRADLARQTVPQPVMRSVLLQNTASGSFQELALAYGIRMESPGWTPLLGDYDHDGVIDAVATTDKGLLAWKGKVNENSKVVSFEDQTKAWGLGESGLTSVLEQADLDADGDLDMVGRAADGTIALYENVSLAGTRLLVELIATKTPIGARIEVETSKGRFVRLHAPGAGVPMALGNSLKIDSVTVHWPSGALQVLHDIPINSHVTIAEPDSPPVKPVKRVQPMYTASKAAVELVHEESGPPRSRTEESMLGPGMACADVNGDGLDEVYLGGAAGIVGQLFVRKSSGFRAPLTKPFLDDIACEDLGAVFADFNADGHIDLFVVSGGVESPVGSASYRDRLYWGNSRGGFVKAEEEAVPDLRDSGGPVAAADFDGDGDLDLFVGGRCVPGKPNADAKSRLLVNRYEPGRPQGFTTGGFTHTGRITSAVWSDIDGDASIDLVVLDETRGLSIWRNVKGQLSEHKMNVKLPAGRWSAIVPGDMDNDGAMDYGLMNLSGESGVLKNDGAGRFEWVALPVLSQWSPARSAHWLDADGDGRQDLFMVQNLPAAAWPEAPRGGGVGQAFRGMPGGGFEAWAPRESGFVAPGVASAFVLTDLNNDHAPDFLIARNDQPMYALERNPSSSKWLTIRFHGPHRNIMAIGTRVAIDWNGRLKLLAELYGGSGYLTQSANRVFFPRPSSDGRGMIKVYWPDGTRSQMSFSRKEPSVIIRHKG